MCGALAGGKWRTSRHPPCEQRQLALMGSVGADEIRGGGKERQGREIERDREKSAFVMGKTLGKNLKPEVP